MKLEKEILGVIELINKRGGSYFNKSDEDILIYFADLAVIALNKRLLNVSSEKE